MTRTYGGAATGFVPTYSFSGKHDNMGFMGYNPKDSAIYIAYRGSSDIQNWITNLDATLKYCPTAWAMDGCEVHGGFLSAEQDLIGGIIQETKSLMAKYPSYKVVITGHSLGAALATVTAVDLVKTGDVPASKVVLWHYGSPRVGNDAFSEQVSPLFSIHRVTHHKDMVPHAPTHHRFQHTSGEWYEDPTADVRACSGYEDPTCSYQWSITSISDHLYYMGKDVGAAGCVWV
jgi:predicted lipase